MRAASIWVHQTILLKFFIDFSLHIDPLEGQRLPLNWIDELAPQTTHQWNGSGNLLSLQIHTIQLQQLQPWGTDRLWQHGHLP
jgi:hypothetical protein